MSGCDADPVAGGFVENGATLVEIDGEVMWAERLDPATDFPSLDAVVPEVAEPAGGWPEGVVIVDRRPVRPLAIPRRSRTREPSGASLAMRRFGRTCRQKARPRERRGRTAGRANSASRDGPSDGAEGDGDGPPSPAADVANRRPAREGSSARRMAAAGRWWTLAAERHTERDSSGAA